MRCGARLALETPEGDGVPNDTVAEARDTRDSCQPLRTLGLVSVPANRTVVQRRWSAEFFRSESGKQAFDILVVIVEMR